MPLRPNSSTIARQAGLVLTALVLDVAIFKAVVSFGFPLAWIIVAWICGTLVGGICGAQSKNVLAGIAKG